MIDASAAWAAEHALLLFLLLPCLAALLALVRRAPGWRSRRAAALCWARAEPDWRCWSSWRWPWRCAGPAVVAFDGALANALGRAMPDAFLWLLSWFTFLGDRDLLALSCVLAVLWLLWRGYKGWPCSAPSRPDWAAR